jgi:hypothetical protein
MFPFKEKDKRISLQRYFYLEILHNRQTEAENGFTSDSWLYHLHSKWIVHTQNVDSGFSDNPYIIEG